MSRTAKVRDSKRLRAKSSTPSLPPPSQRIESPSLQWLGRRARLKASLLLWESSDGAAVQCVFAGTSVAPGRPAALLAEIRAQLTGVDSRALQLRHADSSSALARLATELDTKNLFLCRISAKPRYLLAAESGAAAAWNPRRIREIETLLRESDDSPLAGWIEEECRCKEAKIEQLRGERRLIAFTNAVQRLASEQDPERLAAALLEGAGQIVPFEGEPPIQSIESLLASPGLRAEDAALLRKLAEFHGLRLQNLRLQHLVEIGARMESTQALASGLAHDFNNSLGILLGYTAFLREKLASQPQMQQELNGIERAAQRAIDLTEKLSSFSRRRGLVKKQTLELEPLIRDFLPSIQRSLGDRVTPEIEIRKPLPPIQSVPESIQEILSHLALNARDAMPEGGRFKLRVEAIDSERIPHTGSAAKAAPGSHWIFLEASDTGCGIPQHLLSRIFEPFFTTKEGKEAAGLGCAMIYSIARAHGGWVEVESPPGQGARFRVFLPASPS